MCQRSAALAAGGYMVKKMIEQQEKQMGGKLHAVVIEK